MGSKGTNELRVEISVLKFWTFVIVLMKRNTRSNFAF